MHAQKGSLLVLLGSGLLPLSAYAEDSPNVESNEDDAKETGLSVGATIASAYNYRGINLYADEHQRDKRLQFAPFIAWALPGTNLTLSYYTSYQLTGSNRRELVREGIGAEQELAIAYEDEFREILTWETGLNSYIYPFASERDAGTRTPFYLETYALMTLPCLVDVTLLAAYLYGVQEAVKDQRYGYVNLALEKSFEISAASAIVGKGAYGYKSYTSDYDDNVNDLEFSLGADFAFTERFSLVPAVHLAWTDLRGVPFRDEYFYWVSIDFAYTF